MSTITTIIKLLPIIIQIIQVLEVALPQSGAGQAKLSIAQAVLGAVYDEGAVVSKDMPKERWLAIAAELIAKIVGVFKSHGIDAAQIGKKEA